MDLEREESSSSLRTEASIFDYYRSFLAAAVIDCFEVSSCVRERFWLITSCTRTKGSTVIEGDASFRLLNAGEPIN